MKRALVFFLLASSAFAQNKFTDTAITPACGPDNSKFAVKTGKTQRQALQPETGKALVVFIEDDTEFASHPAPTTRAGLDGNCIGATHGNSYFSFPVDPGEHHLCASWQTAVLLGRGHKTAAAHFTAQAGGIYYFRVKNTAIPDEGIARISLFPLDSDEGQLLASKFSMSTFHPKK
ncbi:MAG: DUF2846 domain-containing protein [Candidatus Acidiferrum sp.]